MVALTPINAQDSGSTAPLANSETLASWNWTLDPRAQLLLADCAACPPSRTRHFKTFAITREEWVEADPTDERVAELTAIMRAYQRKDRDRAWEQPTVERAIDLAARALIRSVADTPCHDNRITMGMVA